MGKQRASAQARRGGPPASPAGPRAGPLPSPDSRQHPASVRVWWVAAPPFTGGRSCPFPAPVPSQQSPPLWVRHGRACLADQPFPLSPCKLSSPRSSAEPPPLSRPLTGSGRPPWAPPPPWAPSPATAVGGRQRREASAPRLLTKPAGRGPGSAHVGGCCPSFSDWHRVPSPQRATRVPSVPARDSGTAVLSPP